MKTIFGLLLSVLILTAPGCTGRNSARNGSGADTTTVADTGYTGIKKYVSDGKVLKEVSFKNGIRYGETRTFYPGGQLYQTIWYENDVREDSARWYYTDGPVFRATPYKNDTVHGIQKQYYRNGKVKAKIGFEKGLRTPYLEEFTQEGRLINNYPEVVVKINDEYQVKGLYRIDLELSDKSTKVKFYRGGFVDGRFDTTKIKYINTVNGKASLSLKKSGKPGAWILGVVAEFTTLYLNKGLLYKEIKLPYNDLQ